MLYVRWLGGLDHHLRNTSLFDATTEVPGRTVDLGGSLLLLRPPAACREARDDQ
jgi:hypothetical protein